MMQFTCMQAATMMIWLAAGEPDANSDRASAMAKIERLASKVVRDEKLEGRPVIEMSLQGSSVTDEALSGLKEFECLRSLDLSGTNITDDGLQHLKKLYALEVLVLNVTNTSDNGLRQVKAISTLRDLSLVMTRASNRGLAHLAELKQLRRLRLERGTFDEGDIAQLCEKLPELEVDQGNGNSAEKRARKHFGLGERENVSAKSIRSAILLNLPVGSSESEVYSFLERSGIGEDGLSIYFPLEAEVITCRIGYDPESGWTVCSHYGIFIRMSSEGNLKDVEVKRWITGP